MYELCVSQFVCKGKNKYELRIMNDELFLGILKSSSFVMKALAPIGSSILAEILRKAGLSSEKSK